MLIPRVTRKCSSKPPMGLKWRLRSMLVCVAALAICLGAWVSIQRRSERFSRLAAYHLQACDVLLEPAGGPLECLRLDVDGSRKVVTKKVLAARGPEQYLAHQAFNYHLEAVRRVRQSRCETLVICEIRFATAGESQSQIQRRPKLLGKRQRLG
jgi:hypothetical protein